MNVISGLMDIAMNPVDRTGKSTTPITYDSNCLEEVCWSCAMLINGKAAMACSSLIHKLQQPVRLEPLSRFPVVRDLAVDRSGLFEILQRVRAWVPIDGRYDLGAGPRISPEQQEQAYPMSRCMSCCLCTEVCPQFTVATGFVRAVIINQVRLFNQHPTGGSFETGSIRSYDWGRRDPRMQLRTELRPYLSKKDSPHKFHLERLWSSHEADHR